MVQKKLLHPKNSLSRYISLLSYIGLLILMSLLIIGPLGHTNAYAAEFVSGQSVNVTQPKENLYASGNQIIIESSTNRDLVATGSTVTVKGSVQDDVMLAGGQVFVDGNTVGGSARIAGGQVSINSVTIGQDVLVFGGNVTLTNVTINGDLIVSAGQLTLRDTVVKGNASINYDTYEGDDLDAAVAGELQIQQEGNKNREGVANEDERAARAGSVWLALGYAFRGQLSVIVATLILMLVLGSRNRLAISTIRFNSGFLIDILYGIGAFVLPFLVIPLAAILALIPYVGTITLTPALITFFGIILLLAFFSNLFVVIYTANLVRNSFNLRQGIRSTVLITLGVWILIELIKYIPILGWLIALLLGIVSLANTGFIIKTLFNAVRFYLKPRATEYSPIFESQSNKREGVVVNAANSSEMDHGITSTSNQVPGEKGSIITPNGKKQSKSAPKTKRPKI